MMSWRQPARTGPSPQGFLGKIFLFNKLENETDAFEQALQLALGKL